MSRRGDHDKTIKQWRTENPIEVGSFVECTRQNGKTWIGYVTGLRDETLNYFVNGEWCKSATIVPKPDEVERMVKALKVRQLEEKANHVNFPDYLPGVRVIPTNKFEGRMKPKRAEY